MFVVDLISAAVLAFVLTVGFAAVVRGSRCRGIGELPPRIWLMCVLSWIGGILLVAFGPAVTGAHWLAFAVTGLLVGLLVLALRKVPNSRQSVHSGTGEPGDDGRPAIAGYFCITLLLFLCAVSLRFYLVHLA